MLSYIRRSSNLNHVNKRIDFAGEQILVELKKKKWGLLQENTIFPLLFVIAMIPMNYTLLKCIGSYIYIAFYRDIYSPTPVDLSSLGKK